MKVAFDIGPLGSGHRVRGVGFYTKALSAALKGKVSLVDFSEEDLTRYDLIHVSFFNLFSGNPYVGKAKKTVVTIHDVIPLIYPKHYPPGLKGAINLLINKFTLRNVGAVITVSETSKKDIVRLLGVPAEKVFVTYEAAGSVFKKLEIGNWKLEITKRYHLPDRFVLYVGDVNYNKNIETLVKACKISSLPLVIVGMQAKEIEKLSTGLTVLNGPRDYLRFLVGKSHPELTHFKSILKEIETSGEVIRLGFVPETDLVGIYNLAEVYCQPSLYEGFGLPVLEAMACGVPVVAAKTPALLETAGKACLFADPKSPEDFAAKISEVVGNTVLRQKLKAQGLTRAKKFTWAKTAAETLKVYKKVLNVSSS